MLRFAVRKVVFPMPSLSLYRGRNIIEVKIRFGQGIGFNWSLEFREGGFNLRSVEFWFGQLGSQLVLCGLHLRV